MHSSLYCNDKNIKKNQKEKEMIKFRKHIIFILFFPYYFFFIHTFLFFFFFPLFVFFSSTPFPYLYLHFTFFHLHFTFFLFIYSTLSGALSPHLHFSFFFFSLALRLLQSIQDALSLTHKWVRWVPFFSSQQLCSFSSSFSFFCSNLISFKIVI